MKIVEFIPQLSSGGAERFVVDLANELSKQHTVYLLGTGPFFVLKRAVFGARRCRVEGGN